MKKIIQSILFACFILLSVKVVAQIGDPGLGGTVKTITGQPVKDVKIALYVDNILNTYYTTANDGTFGGLFPLKPNVIYTLIAEKDNSIDKYTGVTTFDIQTIRRHLIEGRLLGSPINYLAADVNNNNKIDIQDMATIRNFILRRQSELPSGTWRFVDKKYMFTNQNNPFDNNVPEHVNYKLTDNSADFIAIKKGDVNNTFISNLTQTEVRSDNALNLNVEEMALKAGHIYTVPIMVENFNALAFQGTFSLKQGTIQSVESGELESFNDNNYGIFKNAITTSWNGDLKPIHHVFSLSFKAEKDGYLSDILTVDNSLTPSIANDEKGAEMPINLHFNNKITPKTSFELFQNTPNPVMDSDINIAFQLPEAHVVQLTFYTLDGRVILSKNIDGQLGMNNVLIKKAELNAAQGIVLYKLQTPQYVATKKMILQN